MSFGCRCLVFLHLAQLARSALSGQVLVGGTESLRVPMGVSFAPNGQLLVVDTDNHRVLQCPTWQLKDFTQQSCSVLAGIGGSGFLGTQLRSPYVALPVQVSGSSFGLVIADTHNHRIQYWPRGGSTGRTMVGGPGFGAPTYDGPGELEFPAGLAIDEAKGYMYVADTGHHRVVRYTLDVENMLVLGAGLTVAGTDRTPGTNASLLDNPTALALSGDKLYVADARNNRLMTWLVRPELLSTVATVRRLSSVDDDENATGTTTTVTTSSFTFTTSFTVTTTTSTTYTGPRYFLEMDGFTGRPYGIYATDGGVYVSDADGCGIWKKTTTGEKSLVLGGTCGGSISQFYFPAGLVVERGGAIIIADSRNNRVIRFGSEPTPSNDKKCTLGGNCEVTLRNGLPTSRSRLLLVKSDAQTVASGACGGRCVNSGLGGGTWVTLPGSQPPRLTVMTFPFGVAGVGETMRDYIMCYGPEGNAQEVADGNCTSMPYNVGTLRMLPYLSSNDLTTCVRGTSCTVDLDGYGIPDSLVIVAIIDSAYGTGVACGSGSTQNFQGYRAFFLQNPGTILAVQEPYLSQGNRSAVVRTFFGQAQSYGSQLLCACYEGENCNSPSRFQEPIGYIRVRSALTNSLTCRWGESCILNVSGQYLRDTDVVVLTPAFLSSCTTLNFQDASSMSFDNPVANASSASVSSLTVSDGLNFALFDLGTARDNGMFQVCYCASHESEDTDSQLCSSAAEFTHSAGTLVIMRVNTQDYECPLGRACSVEVSGLYMAATDVLLETGGLALCGTTVPQVAAVVGGVTFQQNFFAAEVAGTTDPNASQLFPMINFTVPGDRRLCYCSTYDSDPNNLNDQIQGPCNDAAEFIQPLGLLTIRGPSSAVLSCAANVPCNITVTGFRLSGDDRLQVCSGSCGSTTACAAVGPDAFGGPLSPNSNTSTQAKYGLGSLPLGTYVLCYCAAGTGGTAPISCSSPEDLDMAAGQLRVRGVDRGQLFECAENIQCKFNVTGYDLSTTDVVMAIPITGQCGITDGNFAVGAFNPNSKSRASVSVGNSTVKEFDYDSITAPERYKICYCVFSTCVNASHFTEEVGILVVKGIQRSRFALACALSQRCNVPFNGSGFEISTDSLKLIPGGIPCGGSVLRVTGDGSNDTQQLLGYYDKGSFLFNGRNFYQQRGGRFVVFYDIFRSWWVMNTELDTKEAPFAWADGNDVYAPNHLPPNSWQIWILDNITVIGGGYWWVHPTLRLTGPVDDNWAFSINPSTVMTQITMDDTLGLPYLSSVNFDVGIASAAGTYNLCWCPSWDWPETNVPRGGDFDTTPCSNEQEFFVNNGRLVVGFLTSQARYHCLPAECSVGVPLPAWLENQRAVLLPASIQCADATYTMASPWTSSRNVSGTVPSSTTNWTVFNFGNASVMGEFQVCVCSNYDNGKDSMTCSEFNEFYEAAGPLTVAPQVFLVFESGVNAALNVTRGFGLDALDRIYFQPGFACNDSSLGSAVASPSNVDANGAWAIYALGPQGLTLDSGHYVACLCTNFDGPDSDEVPCNDASEFTTAVGKLQVAAVQGPQLRSSVSGSILLRLTLSRRLSTATDATAASAGFALGNAVETALAAALELFLSPVSVVVTGVTPLRGPATLDVVVNYTATFNGSADQHLLEARDFDNATCPDELLEAPWMTPDGLVVTPAFADSPLLLGCLRLNDILVNEGASIQSAVSSQLQSASIPGVSSMIQVTGLETPKAPVLGYLPAEFRCVRGAPCQVLVSAASGAGTMPASGSLLLIGSGLCGAEDSQRLTTVLASNPVDSTASTPTSGRLVDLGEPILAGSNYILCYCAGSDSGSGTCGSSRDYFSLVGNLSVRGPSASLEAYCVVYKTCTVALFGVELSVWDWLLVKDGTGSCYDSNVVGFAASTYFGNNPTGLPSQDSDQQFFFDLGTATQTGTYQLCYCASYSSQGDSVPCQSPADFTMQAGSLKVRGVQEVNAASYSCVRSSKDDGETACILTVDGTGLMGVQDKMLVIPVVSAPNSSCGEVEPTPTFGVSPNPVPLSLTTSSVIPWGAVNAASIAQWTIDRLEIPGEYQVCYCADSPDGSLNSRGECFSGGTGFYHQVGSLQVRGAEPGQMFLCVPGLPCEILVTGVNLSISDKVRLVGPEDSCSRPKALVSATKIDFIQAIEANESSARFDLGELYELPRAVALRLCYCASFNRDGQGSDCSDVADFTHSAGAVNVALCPSVPVTEPFVVPVQDVYGDPGDPKFRFYSLPAWLCLDAGSRTPFDIARYQSVMQLGTGGTEGKGGASGDEDLVYSTRMAQCTPSIAAEVARLPNANISTTDVSVVGGAGASINGLPIETGFRLKGSISLSDERGNMQTCSGWEVELIAFGCGWDAAMTYGLVLHLLLFATILWSCFTNQIYHCSAFCSWTKKVEPIVESDPNEKEDALRRVADVLRRMPTTPGTPSVRAIAAGGASIEEPDRPLQVLCSSRTAWFLATMRISTVLVQLICVVSQVDDIFIFFVIPLLMALVGMAVQVALVCAAWGKRRFWRCFKRPQYLKHSFTLTLKIHLDLVIPLLAQRHHSELWRPAAVLVSLQLFVQVLLPVLLLLNGLGSGRRRLPPQALTRPMWANPRPAAPQSLEVLEVDATDQKVQAVMQEALHKPEGRRGSLSVTDPTGMAMAADMASQLQLEKIPRGVALQKGLGLQGIATSSDVTSVNVVARRNSIQLAKTRPGKRRRNSVEFLVGGMPLDSLDETTPSTSRYRRGSTDLYAAMEDDRAPTKGSLASLGSSAESIQKREELVLHMFRMKALEEHLNTQKPRWRCVFGSLCFSALVFPCSCCARRCKRLRWKGTLCRSSWEAEAAEEFRRQRIVGLWSFLDSSGWSVAAMQFRKQAEGAGGFQLPHFEDRRACISSAVGGFDLAALCVALVGMYLPRLNYTELCFLLLATLVTLLQVGRPGIFHAASALADDLFLNPQNLLGFFLCAVLLRCITIAVIGFGCASFSWGGYLLSTVSLLILWGPILLFCWRSWPVIWNIVTGYKAPWPSKISTMFTDFAEIFLPARLKEKNHRLNWKFKVRPVVLQAPTPPAVTRAPGATRKLDVERPPSPPNLRDAAYKVMAYRKEQGSEPPELQSLPAEPCLAALVQLVEDIVYGVPQDLSQRILDQQGEVGELHHLLLDLNRQPPHLEDKKRRVRRLLEAMALVDQLAVLCQYMGPMTRLSYDELHAQVLEELWLARSMVRLDSLLRSRHFQRGCLASRAGLLEAQIPTAPRFWLVHDQTLQRLGRLPTAREFEHLTLASDAHQANGRNAIVMVVVHQWRSPSDPDPHGVTWRQLMTFARWYRWRWGDEHDVYFWIDSCCQPEIRGQMPKNERTRPDLWAEREEARPASPDSEGPQSSFAKLMEQRGLNNLAAWSQATGNNLDDEDYVPEVVDQKFLDMTADRKEDADFAGLDAMLPAIFAAAHGVVMCNSHDSERDAWCRLYLSLAYAFLPCGRLLYEVKRDVVHISTEERQKRKAAAAAEAEMPILSLPGVVGRMKPEDAGDGNLAVVGEERAYSKPQETIPSSLVATAPSETAPSGTTEALTHEGTDPKSPGNRAPAEPAPLPKVKHQETARSDLKDLRFLDQCLDRFVSDAEADSYEKLLPVPTDWDSLLLEDEWDMGRIQRLTSVCMDAPTLPTDTGYKRQRLEYGKTMMLICCLSGPKRQAKRKVRTALDDESSSESEEERIEMEVEEVEEPKDLPMLPYTYTQESEEDKMLELYFNRSIKKEDEADPKDGTLQPFSLKKQSTKTISLGTTTTSWFNATSPALTRSLQPPPQRLTLASAPPVQRFHETFVSRAVKTDVRKRVAERICETSTFLRATSVGSGGMAMLSKPLSIRGNVCPDSPESQGVTFDVVIEEVDSQPNRDGLAIGFSAQDPDEWPLHRKAIPQSAMDMPRSCIVGYSGRWISPGNRELVQGLYNPAKLKRGDVVTAVIAGPPASLMRILVNGKVVAQKPLAFTGLDPSKPLWGLLDLEGSCVKLRLGSSLLE